MHLQQETTEPARKRVCLGDPLANLFLDIEAADDEGLEDEQQEEEDIDGKFTLHSSSMLINMMA